MCWLISNTILFLGKASFHSFCKDAKGLFQTIQNMPPLTFEKRWFFLSQNWAAMYQKRICLGIYSPVQDAYDAFPYIDKISSSRF